MELHILTFGFILILLGLTGCLSEERYVCISCQYQTGVRSTECIDQAVNITISDKCQGKCATHSHYNKDTMEVKFVWRGCATGGEGEDKCIETDIDYQCFSTCAGHFCNDKPAYMSTASPLPVSNLLICSFILGLIRVCVL